MLSLFEVTATDDTKILNKQRTVSTRQIQSVITPAPTNLQPAPTTQQSTSQPKIQPKKQQVSTPPIKPITKHQ